MTPAQELRRCRSLVRRIDRLGGPPPHRARAFGQVKELLVQEQQLGVVVIGTVIAGGMLLAFLGYVLWEVKTPVTEAARKLADTMATAGQVLIWGGVMWLGLQAFRP